MKVQIFGRTGVWTGLTWRTGGIFEPSPASISDPPLTPRRGAHGTPRSVLASPCGRVRTESLCHHVPPKRGRVRDAAAMPFPPQSGKRRGDRAREGEGHSQRQLTCPLPIRRPVPPPSGLI